jgi:hypothetical protein
MSEQAQVITTGFQFVKNGVSLNFTADTANEKIIMKGKTGEIVLSLAEAGMLRTMLDQVIGIVVDARDEHLNMEKVDVE